MAGELDAGKPHVQFDEGAQETCDSATRLCPTLRAAAPLCGGSRLLFGGVGGTRPPRLSPRGGNGKGGVKTSLLPQAFLNRYVWNSPRSTLVPWSRSKLMIPFSQTCQARP